MDAGQFKALLIPYAGKMFAIAFGMLGDRDDASDCVQTAFMNMWLRRGELDEVSNYGAYAMVSVRNVCLNFISSKRLTDNINDHDLAASEENDESEILRRAQNVIRIINGLDEPRRSIIIMRDIEHKSFDEIRNHTGLSYENLRTTLSRTRKFIREKYKKCIYDGE